MSLPRGSEVRDDRYEVDPGSRPGKDAFPRGAGEGRGLRRCRPPLELGAVRPDGEHHDGQLAGHRNLRLL